MVMNTPIRPLAIRMHPDDNVAIIANDGGLPAGTVMPEGPATGLVLRDKVPQGHKVALTDIAAGQAVLRYNVPVGYARESIAAGRWVHERLLDIPAARELPRFAHGHPASTCLAARSRAIPLKAM